MPTSPSSCLSGVYYACAARLDNLPAVLSSQLQWLPNGSEMPEETKCKVFAQSQQKIVSDVRSVHDDILIAKLRPGQAIALEAHCIKGASCVALASWAKDVVSDVMACAL